MCPSSHLTLHHCLPFLGGGLSAFFIKTRFQFTNTCPTHPQRRGKKPLTRPATKRKLSVKTYQAQYVEQLKAETLRQRGEEVRAKCHPVNPRVSEDWEPISIQIQKLLLNLPPVLKTGPFTLDFFKSKLSGKYKQSPSAGDIGIALTSLGFVRKRDWSNNGNGRRYWLSPLQWADAA